MEFDKSKVYTALNADELKVGSTVIVADCLQELKEKVNESNKGYTTRLVEILSEIAMHRFKTEYGNVFPIAYLVEPPNEPKYKPFSNTETAFKVITAHNAWVRYISYQYVPITGVKMDTNDDGNQEVSLHINGSWYSAKTAVNNFLFADDGTPVGEKIEDDSDE